MTNTVQNAAVVATEYYESAKETTVKLLESGNVKGMKDNFLSIRDFQEVLTPSIHATATREKKLFKGWGADILDKDFERVFEEEVPQFSEFSNFKIPHQSCKSFHHQTFHDRIANISVSKSENTTSQCLQRKVSPPKSIKSMSKTRKSSLRHSESLETRNSPLAISYKSPKPHKPPQSESSLSSHAPDTSQPNGKNNKGLQHKVFFTDEMFKFDEETRPQSRSSNEQHQSITPSTKSPVTVVSDPLANLNQPSNLTDLQKELEELQDLQKDNVQMLERIHKSSIRHDFGYFSQSPLMDSPLSIQAPPPTKSAEKAQPKPYQIDRTVEHLIVRTKPYHSNNCHNSGVFSQTAETKPD